MKSGDADLDRKFWAALAMFAVLGLLAYFTMDAVEVRVFSRPVDLRIAVFIVLGWFALRMVLAHRAEKIRREGEKNRS